jgi:membrane protease YdiL (CAAX protease family)
VEGAARRATIAGAAGFAVAALWIALGPIAVARLTAGEGPGGEALFTLLFFGPLLVAALIGGALTGVWPLQAGECNGTSLVAGAALGAGGILIAAAFAWMAGTLVHGGAGHARPLLLLAGCGVILLQALAEELYFRGWLQPLLARGWGGGVAVVVTALGFALLHMIGAAHDSLSIANLMLGGLLFGLLARIGGGVWPAAAAHFAWNATEQLGLGLDPNPGLGGFGALVDLDLVGSPIWGGSAEGLNASFGMSCALLALLVPLVVLRRDSRPRAIVPA